jgi:hypothetical protein
LPKNETNEKIGMKTEFVISEILTQLRWERWWRFGKVVIFELWKHNWEFPLWFAWKRVELIHSIWSRDHTVSFVRKKDRRTRKKENVNFF